MHGDVDLVDLGRVERSARIDAARPIVGDALVDQVVAILIDAIADLTRVVAGFVLLASVVEGWTPSAPLLHASEHRLRIAVHDFLS